MIPSLKQLPEPNCCNCEGTGWAIYRWGEDETVRRRPWRLKSGRLGASKVPCATCAAGAAIASQRQIPQGVPCCRSGRMACPGIGCPGALAEPWRLFLVA